MSISVSIKQRKGLKVPINSLVDGDTFIDTMGHMFLVRYDQRDYKCLIKLANMKIYNYSYFDEKALVEKVDFKITVEEV